jgi:AcrR family transcriptional regulator
MARASAARLRRPPEGGVRARTRLLLLDAAMRVFSRKGAGAAAIHEIAAEAGVSNGTFYNYFRTREELLEAVSLRMAERFDRSIAASRADVTDVAERVAIGCRRFVLQAMHDRTWGAALLRVWASSPVLRASAVSGLATDLRAGRRSGRFRYPSEAAAADFVQGAVLAGMRTVLEGGVGETHATADEIVARPLPPLGPVQR